ncbi:hypothetical protein SLS62_007203 [Diatrype stigma]|uniref:Uncharacterized protein n=1 Tax=Diatrype stigma TaxID=117547 RepID=A0AAN9ULI9_9PEZI
MCWYLPLAYPCGRRVWHWCRCRSAPADYTSTTPPNRANLWENGAILCNTVQLGSIIIIPSADDRCNLPDCTICPRVRPNPDQLKPKPKPEKTREKPKEKPKVKRHGGRHGELHGKQHRERHEERHKERYGVQHDGRHRERHGEQQQQRQPKQYSAAEEQDLDFRQRFERNLNTSNVAAGSPVQSRVALYAQFSLAAFAQTMADLGPQMRQRYERGSNQYHGRRAPADLDRYTYMACGQVRSLQGAREVPAEQRQAAQAAQVQGRLEQPNEPIGLPAQLMVQPARPMGEFPRPVRHLIQPAGPRSPGQPIQPVAATPAQPATPKPVQAASTTPETTAGPRGSIVLALPKAAKMPLFETVYEQPIVWTNPFTQGSPLTAGADARGTGIGMGANISMGVGTGTGTAAITAGPGSRSGQREVAFNRSPPEWAPTKYTRSPSTPESGIRYRCSAPEPVFLRNPPSPTAAPAPAPAPALEWLRGAGDQGVDSDEATLYGESDLDDEDEDGYGDEYEDDDEDYMSEYTVGD